MAGPSAEEDPAAGPSGPLGPSSGVAARNMQPAPVAASSSSSSSAPKAQGELLTAAGLGQGKGRREEAALERGALPGDASLVGPAQGVQPVEEEPHQRSKASRRVLVPARRLLPRASISCGCGGERPFHPNTSFVRARQTPPHLQEAGYPLPRPRRCRLLPLPLPRPIPRAVQGPTTGWPAPVT